MKQVVIFLFFNLYVMSICAQDCEDISTNTSTVLPRCGAEDGEIIIIGSNGGVAPYRYELNGVSSSIGFFDLPLGSYQLIVTDGRQCKDTTIIDLIYKSLTELIQPDNAFSPNGDSYNEIWRISGIENFRSAQVRVFNRWGQLVHLNSPYDNNKGWDGTQNGQEVTEGTYYYVISVVDNCIKDDIAGTVTIVR